MRTAIIHYWIVRMRGGERVLEELLGCFPDADVFTHVYDPQAVSEVIRARRVTETFISRLPGARRHYQKYLGLMPRALEELDLSAYDLVISSKSGPAKGVIVHPEARHICYCHSPMRYLYDQYPAYARTLAWPQRVYFSHLAHRLRQWDLASAARVDRFVANSAFVANRIRRVYRRSAEVVHPPVDTDAYRPDWGAAPGDYYLAVSEFVPYKRLDLAVEAFGRLDRRLVVVGGGEMEARLRAAATPNVSFAGRVTDARLRELYQGARALVFPAEEDFGLVPVEAIACGCPVIAFGAGGARETVREGVTGTFFAEQSAAAIVGAVARFETMRFDRRTLAAEAQRFSRAAFRENFLRVVDETLAVPAVAEPADWPLAVPAE